MRRSYATSQNHPARPGSWATRSAAAVSNAVGPGAENDRTTPPTIASASSNPSVGRRDRGASDAEEKILTPASRRVLRPAGGAVSSESVSGRARSSIASSRAISGPPVAVMIPPCSGRPRGAWARERAAGSDGAAPGVNVPGELPRMSLPKDPVSSANTGPTHAPIRTQIAAPENQVTKARAMPKTPNWASLLVTTEGIQTWAESAYPPRAMPVITPVGTRTRIRTSPCRRNHAVNHHSPEVTARPTMTSRPDPSPSSKTPRRAPRIASVASIASSQTAPRPYAPAPAREGGRRHARRYTRCSAVVKEVAKKTVRTRPSTPVALRTSSDDAKPSLKSTNASP